MRTKPPARTVEQVRNCLERDAKKGDGTDISMARMMLIPGVNIAPEGIEFARKWLADRNAA